MRGCVHHFRIIRWVIWRAVVHGWFRIISGFFIIIVKVKRFWAIVMWIGRHFVDWSVIESLFLVRYLLTRSKYGCVFFSVTSR